jgi:hypothetical protein
VWYVQDDQGNPIGVYDVTDPRVTERYRKIDAGEPDPHRVARDTIRDWEVSTVFLGLDHQFGSGPPVLWETMVFGPEPWSEWQDRYTSRTDALAGHARVVAMIEAGDEPPTYQT